MTNIKLQLLRLFNKYILRATQTERIYSERLVKTKQVYNYIEVAQ